MMRKCWNQNFSNDSEKLFNTDQMSGKSILTQASSLEEQLNGSNSNETNY